MSLYEILAEKYGEDFAKKYLAKRRGAVDELTPEELEKAKEFADEAMKHSEDFHVVWEDYDILLVETPKRDDLRQLKQTSSGNFKATVVWNGAPGDTNFVAVFGREETLKPLTKQGIFYIIGRLQEREYNGKKTYAFNCKGVVTIVDLSGVKEVSTEEEDEALEDVEEFVV